MDWLRQFLDPITGPAGQMFWIALAGIVLWEVVRPLRPLQHPQSLRLFANIALAVLNTAIGKFLPLLLAFDLLALAEQGGYGLLNYIGLPAWFELLLGVACLDLVAYASHRLKHVVPIFWRIHRLHHSDPDVDFSTSRRHHPFEVLISLPIYALGLLISGAPPLALLLWTGVEGTAALFQHGNIGLPGKLDGFLRLFLVTPAMHRVHHSAMPAETNSNYGNLFPWWDRLFGSYCARPQGGLAGMTLGLEYFRQREDLFLHRLLLQPFASAKDTPARQMN